MTTTHSEESVITSPSKSKQTLENAVRSAIHPLMKQVTGPNTHRPGPARGTMAHLRRAAGRHSDDPLAWAESTQMLLEHGSEELLHTGDPSPDEIAAFTAITHWALHQQSKEAPMHKSYGGSESYKNFGYAVGRLAAQVDSNSIKGRLDALLLAGNLSSLTYHLRTLIQLLRSNDIPLDYGLLARDIQGWIRADDRRRRVITNWGRGFARGQYQSHTTSTDSLDNPTSEA